MVLMKWVDLAGKTWIINPQHIISVTTTSATGRIATATLLDGREISLTSSKIPDFTKDWYAALTRDN